MSPNIGTTAGKGRLSQYAQQCIGFHIAIVIRQRPGSRRWSCPDHADQIGVILPAAAVLHVIIAENCAAAARPTIRFRQALYQIKIADITSVGTGPVAIKFRAVASQTGLAFDIAVIVVAGATVRRA